MTSGEKKKTCKSCNRNKTTESEFRAEPIKESGGLQLKNKLSMVQNFAMSLRSRGLRNKKKNRANKQLRVLGCFGNQHLGGELPPCEHLEESKTEGKYFCGGCGCGDREGTWLVSDDDKYSKLDYPRLSCPLQMPGFTNYRPSNPDEAEDPVTRKYFAENVSYKELQKVPVTLPEMNEKQKKAMEESAKRMQELHKQRMEEAKTQEQET